MKRRSFLASTAALAAGRAAGCGDRDLITQLEDTAEVGAVLEMSVRGRDTGREAVLWMEVTDLVGVSLDGRGVLIRVQGFLDSREEVDRDTRAEIFIQRPSITPMDSDAPNLLLNGDSAPERFTVTALH